MAFPSAPITLDEIRTAHERIRGLAIRSPLKPSYTLSERLGRPVHLKLETTQPTGAFKVRGAANAILSLPAAARRRGVITMSSGNHGQAVAYVAHALRIPATVCLSEQVPAVKVEGVRRRGANVVIAGCDQASATEHALQLAEDQGLSYISPFDDAAVIAGQGTIALEILDQAPEVDTLIVPLSGGGLMGGIAVAARALRPEIRLIGVSQALGPAMHDSLRSGEIVEVEETPSLADALQGGLPVPNRFTFDLCREHIDEVVLLSELEIASAMVYGLTRERLVLEGGAAVGLGALLKDAEAPSLGRVVAVVLSGDNVDPHRLIGLIDDPTGV